MILNQHTISLRAQCEDLVKDLQQLSQEIGHKELAAVVGELRLRMSEPFMFVIVGEVKAGKSSAAALGSFLTQCHLREPQSK
jgi:hypothetical protein